ncbi:hypothetical protein HanXRQr2_Chr16g0734791 [Helianthus annuus]|uniref:Uncharacterized protein n=1 Tax=Helianthus annuus TaxID=4232 RepID=A0A9K3DRP4_HELAN|nr:hypothetical protein HanXRQr2_Chr16g0734791 [Helianthus annuus]
MQKTYGTLSAVERERLAIHESFESTHWWLRRCMLTYRVRSETYRFRGEKSMWR